MSAIDTDEKATVNELLVNIDRASRANCLLIATTNYVDALDEAVLRSGRFNLLIPVSPPTDAEAADIIYFYLNKFKSGCSGKYRGMDLTVEIPTDDEILLLVKEIYSKISGALSWFCGADLEEVANMTCRRALREFTKNVEAGHSDQKQSMVRVKPDEIRRSFTLVQRSITQDSLNQFRSDTRKFCSEAIIQEIDTRFSKVEQG